MPIIKKSQMVEIYPHKSLPGKGLTYGAFTGIAAEDIMPGGWDVVDVIDGAGQPVSVYSFSVSRGK